MPSNMPLILSVAIDFAFFAPVDTRRHRVTPEGGIEPCIEQSLRDEVLVSRATVFLERAAA
jgi:hypothetical protein